MSGQPTAAQQQQYLEAVRAQMQAQMMQDIMQRMTEKCFKICAGKSGEKLSSSEQTCVVNCMDRYMETMTVTTQALSRQNH